MTDKTREPGTVHRVKKARKEQTCAECDVPIYVGRSYMFLNSFDERSNTWKRYILCAGCERRRSCFMVAELALATEESYSAGSLITTIRERRLMDNDFNHEYQIAWQASEPIPDPEEST